MDGIKPCRQCGEIKDLAAFSRNSHRKDGLQSECRECRKVYSKAYYAEHSRHMIPQIFAARRKRLEDMRRFVIDYLREHPCVTCGETDILVLEFDHLGDKEGEISLALREVWSPARFEREIKKCQVLCANCHRRKTAREQGSYRVRLDVYREASM